MPSELGNPCVRYSNTGCELPSNLPFSVSKTMMHSKMYLRAFTKASECSVRSHVQPSTPVPAYKYIEYLLAAAYMMVRQPEVDTTLNFPRADDPTIIEPMHIKKGTVVVMDFVAMCRFSRLIIMSSAHKFTVYDPQEFPNPDEFKPSRWTRGTVAQAGSSLNQKQADEVSTSAGANTMDGFVGFSIGPRTCLGHKFAKIEAVAFLTYLLREWRVEPVLNDGEDIAQWKARVLVPRFGVTLELKDVPLRFVRRRKL